MVVTSDFIKRLLLTLVLLLQAAGAVGATITVDVSRNPVAIDETFDLIFEADGTPDGEPDFSPLEQELEILSRSQSQSIRMINGDYSRTTRWILTVMARRAGELEVPVISFGRDRSHPLSVQVQEANQVDPASGGQDMFMEVSVEPERAYVQQQLIFHVRIYRAVNIMEASLSAPRFNDPDIIVEQVGEEQNFEVQRNGRRYLVSQISYLAFPQRSGTLTLDPFVFQARVVPQGRHRFGLFGQGGGAIRRIRSEALSIEILPVPKGAAQPWLPLSNLQLSASWPKTDPEFRVGEPVTRTLAIVADGIAAAQLPEIHPEIPPGFKQYSDQPMLQDHKDEHGVTAIRQEKIALVPTRPGTYVLPAVEVRWWNVQTNRQEVARIAEERIQVLPVADAPSPAELPPVAAAGPVVQEARTLSGPALPAATGGGFYPWLSLFLALGWAATAAAWWWSSHRRRPPAAAPEARGRGLSERRSKLLAELKRACRAGDSAATGRALLAWGRTVWPADPPKGLVELAARLEAPAAANILALDQSLYGRQPGRWDGDALWRAVQAHAAAGPVWRAPAEEGLEPLYRQ